jgi:hypothetical protein
MRRHRRTGTANPGVDVDRQICRSNPHGLRDRVWKLSRETADFSPLDFGQRFNGTLSDDGRTIADAWEIRRDEKPWALDFKLTYARV